MSSILFDAPGVNGAGDPFLSLRVVPRPTGPYFYSERAGKNSVAFILIDHDAREFGLLREDKPPIGQQVLGAFGGSLDKPGLTPLEVVAEEVREEAGFEKTWGIFPRGIYHASTQSSECVHLFVVMVKRSEQGERSVDQHEASSEVVWVKFESSGNWPADQTHDWRAHILIAQTLTAELMQYLKGKK